MGNRSLFLPMAKGLNPVVAGVGAASILLRARRVAYVLLAFRSPVWPLPELVTLESVAVRQFCDLLGATVRASVTVPPGSISSRPHH